MANSKNMVLDAAMREKLLELGIKFPNNARFMANKQYKDMLGRVHCQVDAYGTECFMAQDAALSTNPNIGFPVQFYNFFDPEIINIMFSAMNATDLLIEKKEGSFTDDYITLGVEEGTGFETPYSDYTINAVSDLNFSYPSRQTFRYQTSITYGDLEVDKASAARISLVSRKQEHAAMVMARAANKYYLYGVQGYKIYGILNDPNLNEPIAALNASIGGSTKSKWAEKAADPENGAMAILNDIMAMWAEISANNGSLVSLGNTEVVLAISNKMEPYLATTNKFGLSVKDLLDKNFNKLLRVVSVPELSGKEGERLMMICRNVTGFGEPGFCAFTEKLQVKDVQRDANSYKQGMCAATAGAIITRPNLIATMTGI